VQLKSVNNRFLELGLKLPAELWQHEADARAILTGALSRGKVEIYWREQALGPAAPAARLDLEQARAWKNSLLAASADLGVPADLRLEALTRLPGVLGAPEAAEDPAQAEAVAAARWAGLKAALSQAVAGLQASRLREGAALKAELEALLKDGEARAADIEARSTGLQAAFGERVAKRLAQIVEGLPADDPRVLQEAALLVDKADIREELVRFRTHCGEFRRLMDAPEPAGKKLDFLCQELLREANTMGSKSPDAGLTQAVVGLKALIERVKEQVQNVE
jgi:uncharacterized protein (TIGR00255 family)